MGSTTKYRVCSKVVQYTYKPLSFCNSLHFVSFSFSWQFHSGHQFFFLSPNFLLFYFNLLPAFHNLKNIGMHLKYELNHTLQKIWDLSMQDEIVLKNKTLIFAIILDL